MFDALARFADGNARRIGIFAILFFVLAAAVGGSSPTGSTPTGPTTRRPRPWKHASS